MRCCQSPRSGRRQKRDRCSNGQCVRLAAPSVDNSGAMSLQLKVESRKEYVWGCLCVRFSVVVVHRTDEVTQDESFKFNLAHVFRSCLGGCGRRRKCPDGHETADATTVANRYEFTTGSDRRSVDQFDRRPLDGIAAQIMALTESALLWLGVPSCVGPDIRGTTVGRARGARATCAIGLPSQCFRGSRAFSRRIDGLFSRGHAGYQLECLG